MKILQSSVFRAISAIAIGCLLIKYPDNTVTWITVAIGILFLLSGLISLIVYVNARKNVSEFKILDTEGRVIAGEKPTFPIVGVGSLILGALLALTPNVFITALMYIIGGILILGAINQYMNLINARRYGKVGFGFWVFPSVVLLIGLYVSGSPDWTLRDHQANGTCQHGDADPGLVLIALRRDGTGQLAEVPC